MSAAYHWIHKVWYEDARWGFLLLPFSALFHLLLILRSWLYRSGMLRSHKAAGPVIVVGNITVGGTGKTPTVLWLVAALKAKGYRPGIVSRGYGGSQSKTSMRVEADSDAFVVGDEPVLLARRGGCPVVVDADRVRAAEMLLEDGVNVIVSDDGLQHRRLQRDVEICVIDGARGLGNKRLLPAGPLREPPRRLEGVDLILVNGGRFGDGSIRFDLEATDVVRLNGSLLRPLSGFKGTTVHAVAGIGNPKRFFDLLGNHGIQVIEHSFPDHARLRAADLDFGDDFDVLMTEKDAVKLDRELADKFWYVPVDLKMDVGLSDSTIDTIEARMKASA